MDNLKVKIYADGADIDSMLKEYDKGLVKGFTTNPSLMKKAGVKQNDSAVIGPDLQKAMISGAPAAALELPDARIIAFGDAMSEYKVTMAYEGTIFIAVDMENREKRVFPNDVKVYTAFDEEMYNDLIAQMN